jgi:hypothetical protein
MAPLDAWIIEIPAAFLSGFPLSVTALAEGVFKNKVAVVLGGILSLYVVAPPSSFHELPILPYMLS